jgi:hypothetical protein
VNKVSGAAKVDSEQQQERRMGESSARAYHGHQRDEAILEIAKGKSLLREGSRAVERHLFAPFEAKCALFTRDFARKQQVCTTSRPDSPPS